MKERIKPNSKGYQCINCGKLILVDAFLGLETYQIKHLCPVCYLEKEKKGYFDYESLEEEDNDKS